MQIFHGIDELPTTLGATAVTIGNFDGVHLGHRYVLNHLVQQAKQLQVSSVAISFDPHPAFIHRPDAVPELLTGPQEKLARLNETGVDAVLMLKYTTDLASLSPEEFVQQYFVDTLKAAVVVLGHDVRFGRGNSGDFSTMEELGQMFGFAVVEVDDFAAASSQGRCSSTFVRQALAQGNVEAASEVLGRPHAVIGEVVHGEARGRELGFPTANLSQELEGMIPADGVYAGWLTDQRGRCWPTAISVGSNPTFQGVKRVVEGHVIDRPPEGVGDFDLYGQHVRVDFIARLRGMVAYEGVEKLVVQMHQDVDQTRQILSELPSTS